MHLFVLNRAFRSLMNLVSNLLLLVSKEAIWGKISRISLLFMQEQLIKNEFQETPESSYCIINRKHMKDKVVVWLFGHINQRAMRKQPRNGQDSRGR